MNMIKHLFLIISFIIFPIFSSEISEETTATVSVPTIKGITIDDLVVALAGPININEREWSIAKEGDQDILKTLLTGPRKNQTKLKLLEEGLSSIPYDVDADGFIRMCVCLTNRYVTGGGFCIPYQTYLIAQLTPEELALPEVTSKKLSVSFEQHSDDYKSANPEQKARYIENCTKIVNSTIELIIDPEQKTEAEQEHQQLMQQMGSLPRACDIESLL